MMKIIIGKHSWTAVQVWLEDNRFVWLSTAGRQHSRKLSKKLKIIVKPLSL